MKTTDLETATQRDKPHHTRTMAKSVAVFSSGAEQKEQISGYLKFQQVGSFPDHDAKEANRPFPCSARLWWAWKIIIILTLLFLLFLLLQASEDAPTSIVGELEGLPEGKHAIAVHVFGKFKPCLNTLSLNPFFYRFFSSLHKMFSNSFPLLIFDRQSFTRVPIFGTPFQPIWQNTRCTRRRDTTRGKFGQHYGRFGW